MPAPWSAIEGSYDDVNRLCSELAETDEFEATAFVNVNVRPYYAEGSKTLGFEVAEQLGWRLPQQVVAPMASGSLLTKVHKAFKELQQIGLVEPADYRMFGAQSAGCAPIVTAFEAGQQTVLPVKPDRHRQVAQHRQPGGRAVRAGRGARHRRRDGPGRATSEIRAGIQLLAETTGIFAETAGGVTTAVLQKLVVLGPAGPGARRPSSTTPATA